MTLEKQAEFEEKYYSFGSNTILVRILDKVVTNKLSYHQFFKLLNSAPNLFFKKLSSISELFLLELIFPNQRPI